MKKWGNGNTRPNLHFFQYIQLYRHQSPMLTLYHIIPNSTNLYWPSTTEYKPISAYTDPLPSITNQYHFIIHHLIMYIWANWIFFLFRPHLMRHTQNTSSRFHQVQFLFDFVTSNLPAPLGPPLKLRRKCLQLCSCLTLILDSYYFSSFYLTTRWEIA